MKNGWCRRRYYWYFRRHRVEEHKEIREGTCKRCGTCCGHCPFYSRKKKKCYVYKLRPDICKVFPLTPEDLEKIPHCGYKFKPE